LAPGLIFGRRGRPVFLSFASPECEGWRAEGRVPWISPERPGPDRADHTHWSGMHLAECIPRPTARHAASLALASNSGRTTSGPHPDGLPGDRPGRG